MEAVFAVICAVLPSVVLLRYFYARDVHREPRGVLIKTFLLGVLIYVPVVLVGLPLLYLKPSLNGPLLGGLYLALVCVAVPEEWFKFLVVTRYSARHPAFDEPMDGIVYGATASLGFATFENLLCVAGGGWSVALLRGFTAVPMHASLGAILGYYVGQAKFSKGRRNLLWKGLLVAVLLHGLYDFPMLTALEVALAQQEPTGGEAPSAGMPWGLYALFVGVLIFAGIWALSVVRRLRREQLQTASSGGADTRSGSRRRS